MSSRLCPMLAKLKLKLGLSLVCLIFSGLPGAASAARAPREQAPLRSCRNSRTAHRAATRLPADGPSTGRPPLGQACSVAPGDSVTQAPGTHPARPCTQAGPVLSLAGWGACAARRDDSAVAHPGGCLSDWLAGPSSGHACWHALVRHRTRQALIRESLGQQESVLTQVPN